MNKVEQAITRLARILPIKERLDSLDKESADIYLAIIKSFFDQGRAPTNAELITLNPDARLMIDNLAAQDMITLDEDNNVQGCYPFTMEPREHRIQINHHEVHAMCALDALAPRAMFHTPSTILSECAVTREPVKVELDKQTVLNENEVKQLHFGINWAAASSCGSCSDSLCTEMLFLKDDQTASSWLDQNPENREVFDLDQAIDFSAGFFQPMMQQG